MSLRRASLVFTAVVAAIAAVLAMVLLTFSTRLHGTASQIGNNTESLRVAEQLELDLLALRDAGGSIDRQIGEDLLRRDLADANQYVSSAQERRVLRDLGQRVGAYIDALARASERDRVADQIRQDVRPQFAAAFHTVRELVQVNVAHSRSVRSEAADWDRLSDVVALTSILLVVVGLGIQIVWLHRRTFRPALKLVGAIERYAGGERTARATEQGPEEFRTIAHRFNDMATTLERQRENQLEFLAGVAHDLRNPLTALQLSAAMISPDEPLPDEPQLRRLFARFERQIARLDRMVYDLLDAARIESGNLDLQPRDCDLRELAAATVDLFEASAPGRELIVDVPDEPVAVTCDPVRIEQVLSNLVSNAIKYSPQGGPVRVTVRRLEAGAEITVADRGLGIAAEELEHVFEPFRRSTATKDRIAGVGLGLFVCRRIVEAHHGRLEVASTPGDGSTFTVQLPATA